MTPARRALAEAAALERARAARPCPEHHRPGCSRGPADPVLIAELVDAVFPRGGFAERRSGESV